MEEEKKELEEVKNEDLSTLEEKADEASKDVEAVPTEEVNKEVEPIEEQQNFVYEGSLQKVEDKRKDFLKIYKKSNTMKWIIALVGLAIIIFSWVGFANILAGQPTALPAQICGCVGGLALVLVYTLVSKKSLTKKMREYFRYFYEATAEYSFDQEGFANAVVQTPDKLTMDEFSQCGMYRNLVEVGSRGKTAFEYHNIPVMVSDAAGQVKGTQRILPVFVGKYFYAPSTYMDENPIIIYIKGTNKPLPPTDVDDKKIVEDNDVMTIWSNNPSYKKALSTNFRKLLSKIKLNKDLVDVAISMKGGQCFVCLGYDDPLMVLPLQKPFNPHPYEGYKKDLLWAASVIEELNK